ncbi:MAG TPA: hypothetical protein VLI39_13345 [Sedimentisphaerales bacterium]|nr:hypothetical protein [Sedimentisphaerales bacterium]
MRECEFVFVLLSWFAVAAQAINTTTALNERNWAASQRTLIDDVGPLNDNADVVARQALDVLSLSDNGPLPSLYAYLDLSPLLLIDPAASLGPSGSNEAGPMGMPLSGGMDHATSLLDETHWDPDAEVYGDTGLITADRESLPAFAEIDWMAAPLPAAGEISVMEIVVFPALGALVVVSILGMLIVRLRRRLLVRRARQLLQV